MTIRIHTIPKKSGTSAVSVTRQPSASGVSLSLLSASHALVTVSVAKYSYAYYAKHAAAHALSSASCGVAHRGRSDQTTTLRGRQFAPGHLMLTPYSS